MNEKNDLKGRKFGEWTVIKRGSKTSSGNQNWICKCLCGRKFEVRGYTLKSGASTKCKHCVVPYSKTKYTKDPIKIVWRGMKQRCYNENHQAFNHYGGRGIEICSEWLEEPSIFYNWAYVNGYGEGMSIERINNNEGYSPGNCKFIPMSGQSMHRRTNNYIEINNETKTLGEWCKEYNIKRSTASSRIQRGWSPEKAITTPVGK